ncbi:MAG: gamma-glutamyltransferase family protein [Woeseiaceae bacterium]
MSIRQTIPKIIMVAISISVLYIDTGHAQRAEQGPKPVARAPEVMASSSHPRVTRAILEVLQDGGNAVDAMLTAIPLQHVVEPQMSTLAGGMGGLIYWAKTGELIYLDAELDHTVNAAAAPSMARPEDIEITSGQRIGVPGIVPGLAAAAERYGTRSWKDYFGPAIDAASNGFTMYSFLYGEMYDAFERLGAHPASREKWMPDGFILPVGDNVRQPRLAQTLTRLANEGPEYFTKGPWAEHFVDEVNRTGGQITLKELSAYKARWVEPLQFSYKGHQLFGAPPASTAGVLNGMIFNILEQMDLKAMGHYTASAESFYLIRKAYEQAELFTTSFIGDPNILEIPARTLLSKEFGQQLATLIEDSRPRLTPRNSNVAAGAPSIKDSYKESANQPHTYTDTNHLVIVDEDGNWVSMTHTVYGDTFGTGLSVDGVGANSGNTFPGSVIGNGRRVITPFPALMAVDDSGKPWLALGSPGLSSRAVALTLINLIGYGMSPYEAVDAPRFQGYGRYDKLQVESRIPQDVLDGLEDRGVQILLSAPYNWHMGSIQLIVRDAEGGELTGVADPRRAGHAEGY